MYYDSSIESEDLDSFLAVLPLQLNEAEPTVSLQLLYCSHTQLMLRLTMCKLSCLLRMTQQLLVLHAQHNDVEPAVSIHLL